MNLAVGLVMFVVASNTTSIPEVIATSTPVEEAQSSLKLSKSTEAIVKEYFKDEPILIDIARCESRFTHFNKDGEVQRGKVNNKDVGVMQINEHYHLNTALKMGIDIHTIEGNLKYARYLYEKKGSQPWSASAPCWSKVTIAQK